MKNQTLSNRGNKMNLNMAVWGIPIFLTVCSMGCGAGESGQSASKGGSTQGAAVNDPLQSEVLEIITDNEHHGAFVSLERNRIILINSESAKRDFEGTNVIADFWFEPEGFQIQGLKKEIDEIAFHVGADTFVASVVGLGLDELTSAPDSVHWSSELRRLKPGTVFLAKSSSGFVYKVLLLECTLRKMVISYLRLEQ